MKIKDRKIAAKPSPRLQNTIPSCEILRPKNIIITGLKITAFKCNIR